METDRGGAARAGRRPTTTQADIADVALELFATNGFSAVSVDDIAVAAGISRRTLFRYYPSKVAVALAPVTDAIALALDAVEGRPADEAPIVACLAVVAAADEHGLAPAPGAAEELRRLRTSAPLRAGVVQVFDEAADRLTVDFARRLGVRPDAPVARQTATAVMGTVLAVFRHWVDEPDGSDLATEASAGFRRLQQGLR